MEDNFEIDNMRKDWKRYKIYIIQYRRDVGKALESWNVIVYFPVQTFNVVD